MKCMGCHLLVSDWNYLENDGDVFCLLGDFPKLKRNDFEFERNGCTRSNKWILAQDPKKIKNEIMQKEADAWCEYIAKKE